MKEQLKGPSQKRVARELKQLRAFIEREDANLLTQRVAQAIEHGVRWAREDTDWGSLLGEAKLLTTIIRQENK